MSDTAKISESLTMSIDMSKAMAEAGPSADKLGELFNTRFREKLASAAVSTNIADKWSQQLAHGLNGGLDGIEKQLVNKLSSVATSIERFNFGPSVINKLGSVVQEAIRFQMDGVLAAARQMESVIAAITTPRIPQQSFTPMGAFGQGMPAGTLNPTGAFGHGGGVNSPTAEQKKQQEYNDHIQRRAFNRQIEGRVAELDRGGTDPRLRERTLETIATVREQGPASYRLAPPPAITPSGPYHPDREDFLQGRVNQHAADVARQQAQGSHERIPTGQRVHAGLPTRATGESSPEADAAFRQRYELKPNGNTGNYKADREFRENTALGNALLANYGSKERDADNRRMSRQSSHATRFAAQNIGFGVDDAIQSYHYGGIGGSIRAASNNATAIAGMLIPNPAAAAASVIGISIASAMAPTLISMAHGTQGRMATDDRKIYEAGISQQPSYDLAIKKGEGRSLARSSQNDLLGARVAAATAEKEATEAGKQWKIKARELTSTVQHSSVVGQWGMALQHLTGTGMTGELSSLTEQRNGTIQKRLEARKKQETAEAQYEKAVDLAAIEREDSVIAKKYDRNISDRLAQGGFSNGNDMATAISKNFDEKIKKVNAGPGDRDGKQFRIRNLEMDRADALSDPEDMHRRVRLAFSDARQANRNYTERYSGDNSRLTSVNSAFADQAEINYRDNVAENISDTERQRRDDILTKNTIRLQRRANEDDITDINPELNPYKNQLRQLERTQEDISLRPKEQQTEQYRAALIAAERRLEDMRPQARSFISQSVVGSLQDEELRARMTGNYGPAIKRDDHKGEDQAQLIAKLEEVRQQLQLEVQQIGH